MAKKVGFAALTKAQRHEISVKGGKARAKQAAGERKAAAKGAKKVAKKKRA